MAPITTVKDVTDLVLKFLSMILNSSFINDKFPDIYKLAYRKSISYIQICLNEAVNNYKPNLVTQFYHDSEDLTSQKFTVNHWTSFWEIT